MTCPPVAEATPERDDRDGRADGATFPVVGVGASAGGLEAVTHLLTALPSDTGMAFVLVQHLSPTHASALSEILSRATRMPVLEVQDDKAVAPDHVYVIPPGGDIVIAGGRLRLVPRQGNGGAHHPIDRFFRALAEERRHQAIGVVLSGSATDGTAGLEAIKAEGGFTFAQDDSAMHEGMPHSAIASGCVDLVLPPQQIAHELMRIARHPYAVPESDERARGGRQGLQRVLQGLQRATGVDFGQYKYNTVYRRVTRRMLLQRLDELDAYAELLQRDPAELQALYRDILINVTRFFRDPEAIDALQEKVFPRLLEGRAPHDAVRIWTLGCSTGQEAYSVAMAFTEVAERLGRRVPLQIFATDLSEPAVETARAGRYPKDIAQDLSPERLRRFFVEVDGHYRIAKAIRGACVFSRHNVLVDPPFSRLDLVTCRNLLIYLEPALQQKLMPTLHYALKPSGWLWLGASETVGGFRNLFDPLDVKHKIYARKAGPQAARLPLPHDAAPRAPFVAMVASAGRVPDLHREADRLLLNRFAPPSVLVSADLDILQFRGDTSPYLAPAPGKATLNLAKMLREGLLVGVRAALLRARKSGSATREQGLRVKSHDGWREVCVEVLPLDGSDGADANAKDGGGFLVLFDEPGSVAASAPAAATTPTPDEVDAATDPSRLARELAATREYLQSVIEQHEAANEELQSSNEEIQSANEELQSINEELETSKEEVQSSNEELATVNDELNSRNAELSRLNNDLVNVLGSVDMPIVLVGPDLSVRRFTPAAEKLLGLVPGDVGRPLAHIRLGLAGLPEIEPLLAEVLDTVSARELEVRDKHGSRHALRLRPYRTLDNRIDGAVVMLVDIEALKRAHDFTASIVATVHEPLLVLDAEQRVRMASDAFYRTFGVGREQTEGRLLYELGSGQWNIPELRLLLEALLPRDQQVRDYEVEQTFENIGRRAMRLNAQRLLQPDKRSPAMVLLAIEDVTELKQAQAADKAQLAAIVTFSRDAIVSKDLDGIVTSWNRGAEDLFGYSADEMIGQPLTRLIPDDHLDDETRILERVRRGEVIQHYETVRRRKDGSRFDISLTVSPLRDAHGAIVGASKIARDITGRKRAEEALGQSEARFRALALELAQADRHKNQFLAMLAHELRNPLAPIRHALQIVRLAPGDGETARRALDVMERQVRQLVRLVDDLLDVNRISSGRLELRRAPVDLRAVVQDAAETMQSVCAAKGLELALALPDQPLVVDGDAVRLTQAMGNLLGNACKYTDAGGVRIIAERDGETAVLRVRDSGIGIAAEHLARVFDMFMQIEPSPARSGSSLGIGLTLVRTLVDLHGGTVQATSDGIGRGSEFIVRLPLAAPGVQLPLPTAQDRRGGVGVGRRILVVDDNRDAAETLAQLLQLSGHETRLAHDGLEAVQAAADFRPEVVLLDIGLPRLNGYDAARRMREAPWGRNVVLVALTGWGRDEDRQKSVEAGFDAHLVKPVDPDALLQLLADLPAPDPGAR